MATADMYVRNCHLEAKVSGPYLCLFFFSAHLIQRAPLPSAPATISSMMHVIPDLVYSKHEQSRVAQVSANYVAHLFNCVSHGVPELKLPPLVDFIDSVLDCYLPRSALPFQAQERSNDHIADLLCAGSDRKCSGFNRGWVGLVSHGAPEEARYCQMEISVFSEELRCNRAYLQKPKLTFFRAIGASSLGMVQ